MFAGTKLRPLNHLQKQRITSNLFVLVALGAIATVAAPTLFPCPAFDQNDKAARLEARRKLKEQQQANTPVIIKKRRTPADDDNNA
ncbi:hypothetical protein BCR43DRAFT_496915 [Syncephalastrum racemosum]|uniref:Uncharacterized protein n=1 Tax=Syncephalastrum racemosum TaxID=13706 RepID=A0A1X2H4X0_SYNRA|nr:hypothetical protein BCR43DRAFT_496915 [Syncephalastrum racemosum]